MPACSKSSPVAHAIPLLTLRSVTDQQQHCVSLVHRFQRDVACRTQESASDRDLRASTTVSWNSKRESWAFLGLSRFRALRVNHGRGHGGVIPLPQTQEKPRRATGAIFYP